MEALAEAERITVSEEGQAPDRGPGLHRYSQTTEISLHGAAVPALSRDLIAVRGSASNSPGRNPAQNRKS